MNEIKLISFYGSAFSEATYALHCSEVVLGHKGNFIFAKWVRNSKEILVKGNARLYDI